MKRNVFDFQRLYRRRFLKCSRSERRFSQVRFENVEVRNPMVYVSAQKKLRRRRYHVFAIGFRVRLLESGHIKWTTGRQQTEGFE